MSVGSVRRSSRLSAAVLPQASPCSNLLSPRRVTRRSLALAQTPVQAAPSPAQSVQTPAQFRLTLNQTPAQASKSQQDTPQSARSRKDAVNVSLCCSPVKEVRSDDAKVEGSPAHQSETVSTQDTESTASVPELSTPAPMHSFLSISVVEEQDEPAEAIEVDLQLSPRLSLSPCKTPLPVSEAPEPSPCLSFTLSPCVTISQPPTSPTVQSPGVAQESVCHTPDSSFVEVISFSESCFCNEKSLSQKMPFNKTRDPFLLHSKQVALL